MDDKLLAAQAAWEAALKPGGPPEEIAALVKIEPAARTAEQKKQLQEYYFDATPERKAVAKQSEEAKRAHVDAQEEVLTVMVMARPTTGSALPAG
jgi:hypothetical protein